MGCQNGKSSKEGTTTGTAEVVDTIPVVEKPKVKVYGLHVSMNSMGPILVAEAYKCGVLFPTAPGPETNTPKYLSFNPFHAIPTIKDQGFSVAESNAILRFMARDYHPALYPLEAAVPVSAARCAFVDWAMDRFSSAMAADVAKTIYPVLGLVEPPEDQAKAGEDATRNLEEFAAVFLKQRFVGGDKPSIADYKVAPFFFAYEHPKVQEIACVKLPERIREFNADFYLECPSANKLTSAGGSAGAKSIKETLDKGGHPTHIPSTVKKEQRVAVREDLMADLKLGGKENLEIHGVTISMNCMGAVLLAEAAGLGKKKADGGSSVLVQCMPGVDTVKEEFLAMNPFHGIPTLKDGEFCCAESNAILRYLAQAYAPEYYPEDSRKQSRVDWALDRFSSSLYNDVARTLYVCYGFVEDPGDEELAIRGKAASENMDSFAQWFLEKPFIGGERPCIADFKVAPFFFGYGHPYVKKRLMLELPERIVEFNRAFAEAVGEPMRLLEKGEASIQEFLASRETAHVESMAEKAQHEAFRKQAEEAESQQAAMENNVLEFKGTPNSEQRGGGLFCCQ